MKNKYANRMVGIDFLRVLCAFIILFIHMNNLGGVNLKKFGVWCIQQREFVMIFFFILSGFCLSYSKNTDFSDKKNIFRFYKKRLLRILPLYFAIEIFRLCVGFYDNTVVEKFVMFPIRILGLQMEYTIKIFAGIGWFIAVIIACYFLYPFLVLLFQNVADRYKIAYCTLAILILVYTKVMERWFGLPVYYSVFFRVLQFSIGVVMPKKFGREKQSLRANILYICAFVVLLLFISYRVYFLYSLYLLQLLSLPIVVLLASKIDSPYVIKAVVGSISNFTFEIFLLQDIIFSQIVQDRIVNVVNPTQRFLFYFIFLFLLCCAWKTICWSITKSASKRKEAIASKLSS